MKINKTMFKKMSILIFIWLTMLLFYIGQLDVWPVQGLLKEKNDKTSNFALKKMGGNNL